VRYDGLGMWLGREDTRKYTEYGVRKPLGKYPLVNIG
jgi:hypothetical protein